MKEAVPNVIPIHHYGDDLKWIDKYLQYTDYIGLSPANDTDEKTKQKYFDFVFRYLPDDIKTHAFGYSSPGGMQKYPFYSVDSTVWLCSTKFKDIINYYPNRKMFYREHVKEFIEENGYKYTKGKLSKELIDMCVKHTIKNIIDFMIDLPVTDYSYLKAQKTLF